MYFVHEIDLVGAVPVVPEECRGLHPHVPGLGGVQDEGDVVEIVVLDAAGATGAMFQYREVPSSGWEGNRNSLRKSHNLLEGVLLLRVRGGV